jgi:hypothetical protein
MPHVVILPHVIEQKLAENERQEVIGFINDLIADTAGELKKDIIEIVEEKFERRLSDEITNLKVELTERIGNSEVKLAGMIANSEVKSAKNIADLEVKLTEMIVNSEAKLTEKIANSEARSSKNTADNKAEMIRWMFIFWLGNIITIIGGIVGILKIAKVF